MTHAPAPTEPHAMPGDGLSAELAELIGELRILDIQIGADGGALSYDAPEHALSDALLSRLRDLKPQLLHWLAGPGGTPVESSGPATLAQVRAYEKHHASGKPAGFNVAQRIPLTGTPDVAALSRAFAQLLRRQSALRSRMVCYGAELVQEVVPLSGPFDLAVTDLRALPTEERARAATTWVHRLADEPFDLAVAPLLRAALLRTGDASWTLVLVVHHIVIDGWGLSVLLSELGACYTAALRVPGPSLPSDEDAGLAPLAATFADVGRWQRAHLAGPRLKELRTYWGEALAGAPLDLPLPYDRPRPEVPGGGGAELSVRIPREVAAGADALARATGTTAFTVLLSAFGLLLGRLTGRQETVVACNIANRVRQEHESVVGFFTNNVALRLGAAAEGGFAALVAATARTFFAAADHQDYPLHLMLADRAAQDGAGPGLFPQAMIVMQNQAAPVLDLPGLVTEVHDIPVDGAKAELCVILVPGDDGIEVVLLYSTDLFDAATVEGWGNAYVELLAESVRGAGPDPAAAHGAAGAGEPGGTPGGFA